MTKHQDIFGLALTDYYNGLHTADIAVHAPDFDDDTLSIPYLFRDYPDMPLLEQKALTLCTGMVLDVGCCAGSHSLFLQEKRLNVQALDISAGAVTIAKKRGVRFVKCEHVLDHNGSYDTILMLMNGTGIFETLEKAPLYLSSIKKLLNPSGQLLIDSSDLKYLYEGDAVDLKSQSYYGEMRYTLSYKNKYSPSFNWLYLDFPNLNKLASNSGYTCECIYEDNHYGYLAKLSI